MYNGFGAIASAYGAYKLGLKSEVFLGEVALGFHKQSSFNKIINSRQINTLHALGSKIHLCPDYSTAKNLEYGITTLITIEKDVFEHKKEYYKSALCMHDEDNVMVNLLSKKIAAKTNKPININFKLALIRYLSSIAPSKKKEELIKKKKQYSKVLVNKKLLITVPSNSPIKNNKKKFI